MQLKIGSWKPVLALLFLAPTIPELLTGSTPITLAVTDPHMFVLQFMVILGLYGAGALLIREASARWRKGWGTILLLGAAYGIMEEGIAVHTFFEASGNPVGVFGTYGRAFGVNWVWAAGLTIFHSLYSISLPILLVELLFPEYRRREWFDRGFVGILMIVYFGLIALLYVLTPSKPDFFDFLLFLAISILLVFCAYFAPKDILRPRPGHPRGRPVIISLSAAVFFASWLIVDLLAKGNTLPPLASVIFLLSVTAISAKLLLSRVGDIDNEMAKLSIATGMLSALFVWDIFIEFVSIHGILLVTAVFVYLLIRLHRSLSMRYDNGSPPAPIM